MVLAHALAFLLALGADRRLSLFEQTSYVAKVEFHANSARAMLETRDGYLWIATEFGLRRFDGARFMRAGSAEVLRTGSVRSLAEGADGTLWVGTDAGLVLLRTGRWQRAGDADGLEHRAIVKLHEDRRGRLWVATDEELFVGERGRFAPFRDAQGKGLRGVVSLLETREGALLFASAPTLLHRLDGGRLVPIAGAGEVAALAQDGSGVVWAGGRSGLFRLGTGGAERVPIERTAPDPAVTALLADRAGTLWVGTAPGGLLRRTGSRTEVFRRGHPLALLEVRALYEDSLGVLWVGSEGRGLVRLRETALQTWSTEEGLPDDSVLAVAEAPGGELWVGTRAGLALLRAGRRDPPAIWVRGLPPPITALFAESAESLVVGSPSGAFRLRGERIERLPLPPSFAGEDIEAIAAADGALYFASAAGLFRLPPRGRGAVVQALAPLHPTSLRTSSSGTLLVGTHEGALCRVAGEQVSCIAEREGLPARPILDVLELKPGALLLATAGGGLRRVRDWRAAPLSQDEGLETSTICSLVDDGRGHLWLGTMNGVWRVARRSLADEPVHAVTYGIADGMRSMACGGAGGHGALRSSDGRLWFATPGGVAQADPARLFSRRNSLRVLLEEATADRQPLDLFGDALRASAGADLLLRWTAFGSLAPKRLRFRHRLVGHDADWRDSHGRIARYAGLAPGRYTLLVAVREPGGVFDPNELSIPVVLAPRFFQTAWFRLGSVAAAALLLLGADRLRARSHKLREAQLEALVCERTEELQQAKASLEQSNRTLEERVQQQLSALREAERLAAYGRMLAGVAHEVRQPIFAISAAAYVLREQLRDRAELRPHLELLARETQRMGVLMEELLDFARPAGLLLTEVPPDELFREAAETFRAAGGRLPVEVQPGDAPPLLLDRARFAQVLLNLLENADKHAKGASAVRVRATRAGAGVELVVEDDGAGIAREALPQLFEPFFTTGQGTGLGLAISKRLVEQHGGRIFAAQAARGARFVIALPPEVIAPRAPAVPRAAFG